MDDLSNRYHFSDFTLENYRNLLALGFSNYSFKSFLDKKEAKTILLRHDVEFSIPIALQMAEIESALGIRATYFVQLHSEFYNTLEKATIDSIKIIHRLGHQIGLHFDSHYWNIEKESELEQSILFDKEILEKYLNLKIEVFSFHNNTKFTLSCRKKHYGGLLNVYSDYFRRNYAYNSDSLGYWRYERMEERLREAKENTLQILIHDGMWQDEAMAPRRRVFKVIDDRSKYLKDLYDGFLKEVGQKNIDWEGEI